MAKRGGGSGRKYVRDSIGRFAGKGYSGQTSGRGARLKAKGKKRDGGGAIVKPTRIGEMKNTISKSSSKRKVNASSRATDRQIARDVAARSKPTAVNKISKSPRQLNKDEKIARDVMTDKRFKSDRQRATEMLKRGIKPGTDVGGLVANVRSKQGGGTTSKIKPAAAKRRGAVGKISEAKATRKMEAKSRALKKSAAKNSARMGYTNASPADQLRLATAAKSDRARSARIDKALKNRPKAPRVMAEGRGLTGESLGRYKGMGRQSLYGKDLSKTQAKRPPSTIAAKRRKPKRRRS